VGWGWGRDGMRDGTKKAINSASTKFVSSPIKLIASIDWIQVHILGRGAEVLQLIELVTGH
jgi:hypothetical protein